MSRIIRYDHPPAGVSIQDYRVAAQWLKYFHDNKPNLTEQQLDACFEAAKAEEKSALASGAVKRGVPFAGDAPGHAPRQPRPGFTFDPIPWLLFAGAVFFVYGGITGIFS